MANLAKLLTEKVNGATFVSINTETEVKLKGGKSNPQQGRITKRVTGSSVMVFQNKMKNGYNEMVQRRLSKEGKNPANFQLQPRKWGTRLQGVPFVEHNGRYYVEVIFLHPGEVQYLQDGQPIAKEDIEGLQERNEAYQGGLDDKVIIRTYAADSIKGITIDKKHYDQLIFNI